MVCYVAWSLLLLQLTVCLLQESLAISGPKLKILNVTETEILVEWSPITDLTLRVEKYQISANPLTSYGPMDMISRYEWTYYNTTTHTKLFGLLPGTRYNISVLAYTNRGASESSAETTWTEIGEPDTPPAVEIVERDGKTITVNLPTGSSDKGPVTNYQVIVLEKSPIIFLTPEELDDYSHSQQSGLPFYIAADLLPEEANQTFVVGNQKTYGRYYNAPLVEDKKYEILVGVASTFNGVTKVAYSSLQPSENSHSMNSDEGNEGHKMSNLTETLSILTAMVSTMLVCAVFFYYYLKRRHAQRYASDELVLRVHGVEGEENGFLPGTLHIETDLAEFYEQLKQQYWQIPKNQIDVHPTVLGGGQFGEVREGTVIQHSLKVPCLVQHIPSPGSMKKDEEKRCLLDELDVMVQIGFHPNIIQFLGGCDEQGILLLAIEHHSASLRGSLLRCRQQQNGNINNMSEEALFAICGGIAHGMAHLAEKRVVHKRLSSRNILMDESSTPKIAHFALGHYYPLGKKLRYTRWSAPESLGSKCFTTKSDVWSFGVLLYEIFTLGGSPFNGISSKQLLLRLMQGLRLSKPKGISDDLFQIMLQCWEIDPDERPSFVELSDMLQNMLLCAEEHVNFQEMNRGKYEKFDPKAEDD